MDDFLKVNVSEYLPLRDVVFNTLREAILRGDLVPGERLLEVKLAKRLGVSRTPIREAIRKLELEGLVNMIPRKGAEVARISEKSLKDVLEVRRALEELAVEMACNRIEPEKIDELEIAHRQFKEALESNDVTHIAERDVKFHEIIYEATDNQKLVQMINNLREYMYRYRVEYIKDKEKRIILIEEHKDILEALRTHDIKRAKLAMRKHIDNQESSVAQKINS